MKNITVSFEKVKSLYPNCKIMSVVRGYVPGKGKITSTVLGDKYPYESLLPDELVKDCYEQGATIIALRIEFEGKIREVDYGTSELVTI